MEVLYGYTVLRDKDKTDKPWAIVRIDVRFEDNPGKASQYILVIDYHDSRNIACYYASMLSQGTYNEEQVQESIKTGGLTP